MNKNQVEEIKKELYLRFDSSLDFENAVGGLKIFIPAGKGYINYNFVHSVNKNTNCDMWRLGRAFAFDDNFENEYALTPLGAEWDMALKLQGRPDFIGGFAHGDEVCEFLSLEIDNKNVDVRSLSNLTPFNKLAIKVKSVGFDPLDSCTQVLIHTKEYLIDHSGIELNQEVKWLNDYTLDSSYLAMMPPLKTLTDRFCTDVNNIPKEACSNYGYVNGAKEAVVYGSESGFKFCMSVPRYPHLPGGDKFLLTDNGGGLYNKMYFFVCEGAGVSKGDVWESTTKYAITN